MSYFVMKGKGLILKRGVVTGDDPHPPIEPLDVASSTEVGEAQLRKWVESGVLVEAKECPAVAAEVPKPKLTPKPTKPTRSEKKAARKAGAGEPQTGGAQRHEE